MNTKAKEGETVQLDQAPQIEGLSFRHFRGEEDFAPMVRIFDLAKAADSIRETSSEADLAHYYRHKKRIDPKKDVLFAEINGDPVAYARVSWEDEHEGPRRYRSRGDVLPEWRRKGLGTALLAHNEARLREMAAGHPDAIKKILETDMADTELGAMALVEKAGYTAQRYFYFMLRPLDEPIPEAVLPAGIEMRPVDKSQMRKIWEAQNEAFRDHWGHVEGDEDDYTRWATDPVWNLGLWQVAWEGDQIAGMILNHVLKEDNAKLGVSWGWTDPISVRRPWRRRGLARNLIYKSLELLKGEGFSHAALGVDTQNPSGALTLYETSGYHIEERWIVYEKPMD